MNYCVKLHKEKLLKYKDEFPELNMKVPNDSQPLNTKNYYYYTWIIINFFFLKCYYTFRSIFVLIVNMSTTF